MSLHVFLLDDGSSDGTATAVTARFPDSTVLHGDGYLFWNRGMARAWRYAATEGADYYLLVNDDAELDRNALARLMAVAGETPAPRIVAATLRDPDSGRPTYGGVARVRGWHPFRYALVRPGNEVVRADTFNANCVLVPGSAVDRVGYLDERFHHSMGDYDYGLRARSKGIVTVVAPGTYGTCARNPVSGTFRDPSLSRAERWRIARGPKGLPLADWLLYSRRHGGPLWPVFFVGPYLRILAGR